MAGKGWCVQCTHTHTRTQTHTHTHQSEALSLEHHRPRRANPSHPPTLPLRGHHVASVRCTAKKASLDETMVVTHKNLDERPLQFSCAAVGTHPRCVELDSRSEVQPGKLCIRPAASLRPPAWQTSLLLIITDVPTLIGVGTVLCRLLCLCTWKKRAAGPPEWRSKDDTSATQTSASDSA